MSLIERARAVEAAKAEQDQCWAAQGSTRRRFLAGVGMVGVAALGSQLVTSRVAYAASPANPTGNTLIVIFLRGGADSLRILAPATSTLGVGYLQQVRPQLLAPNPIPLVDGWAMNQAMAPLRPFWTSGELAFVPAVSAAGITRSHFQAQQFLESGGNPTGSSGWLDRLLQQLGPGTTFRALAQGRAAPLSMTGVEPKLSMSSLKGFTFPAWDGLAAAETEAIATLYRGFGGPLGEDVPTTLAAVGAAKAAARTAGAQNGAVYPKGDFARSLADLATLLRAEVGVEVATVDVGGWDTHTGEAGDLDSQLAGTAGALAAFLTDLGPLRRGRVTVVVQSEFGRRVGQNASGGSDHGHGGLMWLAGGGVFGGRVHGRWDGLSSATLDDGDVAALNHPFDVLGELAQTRLGIGSLDTVFPGHPYRPLGLSAGSRTPQAHAPVVGGARTRVRTRLRPLGAA